MTRWIVTCLLLMVIAGPSNADNNANVAIVEQMINAVNTRDFDALGAYISENVVRHSGSTPGVVVTDLAEFKQFLDADLVACPDAQQEIEIIFGRG